MKSVHLTRKLFKGLFDIRGSCPWKSAFVDSSSSLNSVSIQDRNPSRAKAQWFNTKTLARQRTSHEKPLLFQDLNSFAIFKVVFGPFPMQPSLASLFTINVSLLSSTKSVLRLVWSCSVELSKWTFISPFTFRGEFRTFHKKKSHRRLTCYIHKNHTFGGLTHFVWRWALAVETIQGNVNMIFWPF